MKRKILACILTCILFLPACKKIPLTKEDEVGTVYSPPARYSCLMRVGQELELKTSSRDFNDLNLSSTIIYSLNRGTVKVYKVPFTSKDANTDFILIATDSAERNFKGNIVSIDASSNWEETGLFSGTITFNSLNRIDQEQWNFTNNI